jgi:hypothetical protein
LGNLEEIFGEAVGAGCLEAAAAHPKCFAENFLYTEGIL